MRSGFLGLILVLATPAHADTVFAANTMRAQTILTEQDIFVKNVDISGAVSDPEKLIGMETRVALYAGRPIRSGDVGPPALIERNQLIPIFFRANGLSITAEGRALERAGAGEFVRVMNLSSRTTVSGLVKADGRVMVRQ